MTQLKHLLGCLELTDWDVFFKNDDSDLNLVTDKISSYLTFCTKSVIRSKQVRLYPNNKPWVTKHLKICLNKKKLAFLSGDKNFLSKRKCSDRNQGWQKSTIKTKWRGHLQQGMSGRPGKDTGSQT